LGWLGEKMAVLKLQLDDEADGELALFEGLEAVTIGLEGKRALWETLAIVAEDVPELQGLDYTAVIQRAKEQHQRAEVVRRDAAKAAFRATS
jgi:hypothetical protein